MGMKLSDRCVKFRYLRSFAHFSFKIHGPARRYNNTARWNLKHFLDTFDDVNRAQDIEIGGNPSQSKEASKSHSHNPKPSRIRFDSVQTKDALDQLLDDSSFIQTQDTLRLVEIKMVRGDAPKALLGQAAATQQSNSY